MIVEFLGTDVEFDEIVDVFDIFGLIPFIIVMSPIFIEYIPI